MSCGSNYIKHTEPNGTGFLIPRHKWQTTWWAVATAFKFKVINLNSA